MSSTAASLLTPPVVSKARDDAVAALFAQHFDFVWRSLRRLGVAPGAVDDATQEVFLVAARRHGDIEAGKERAFLFGTALRVASDARRAELRRAERGDDEAVDNAPDGQPVGEDWLERQRARQRLDYVLAKMSLDMRSVFVLFELEGMTMAEIAVCMEVPPGTVASRLRRARELFRQEVRRLNARDPEVRHG